MARTPEGRAGKAVELSSYDVTKRVAGKRINSQEDNVEEQHKRTNSDSKSPVKEESAERVPPEKDEEDEPCIQKVAVQVLKDERELRFSRVASLARFTHGAGGRVEKKGPVVSLSVVVTSNPESQGESKNQESRRKRPPPMVGINEGRIKRREVWSPFVVLPFEGTRSRICSESAEQNNDGK
jgi:hypothetical protein